MERHGEAITAYPLKTLNTGISYRRVLEDLVPEYEERQAARLGGYKWSEWQALPRFERVDGVAYFRIRNQIEMHTQDAQDKEIRRKTKHR